MKRLVADVHRAMTRCASAEAAAPASSSGATRRIEFKKFTLTEDGPQPLGDKDVHPPWTEAETKDLLACYNDALDSNWLGEKSSL